MARIAVLNYTFVKGAANAGTVTFTDYSSITAGRILGIVNTTRGSFIYNPTDSTKLGTVATNVLTLAMDTSAMANTDKLTILYEPEYDQSTISVVNSSSATLTSGSVFTGTSEDVTQYGVVSILVISDVASATNGLSIQQSSNGTNWDLTDVYTIPAATAKTYTVGLTAKFFRIVYTNGGTNQASFRLQTIFTKGAVKFSSVRPQDGRDNENDMEEVLAYPTKYDPILNVWNRDTEDLYYTGQTAQTALINNIIPATASATATDLKNYRSASVQIICPAGTYTTGQIIFEGANDSPTGTAFQTIPVINQLTGASLTTAITLASSTGIGYTFPVSFRYVRVRISTAVSGAGASVQAISTFSKAPWVAPFTIQPSGANLNVTLSSGTVSSIGTSVTPGTGSGNLGKAEDAAAANGDTGLAVFSIRNDVLTNNTSATGDYQGMTGNKWGASYVQQYEKSAKTFSVTQVVPVAAAATDIAILPGNATNTVYVTKIIVSGIQTTAGTGLIQIFKRSTADTLGTTGTFTVVPHDSADTAVSVPLVYTANPTTGTGVLMRAEYINVGSTTSLSSKFEMTAGDLGKHGILSGVTQGLAINLNGVTFTGGSFTVYYQWFEL